MNQQGVLRWSGGRLSRFENAPEVAGKSCNVTYTDRRGRVWVGFNGRRSGGLRGRPVPVLRREERPRLGTHRGDLRRSQGLALGERGRRRQPPPERALHDADARNGPFAGIVPSLVEDNDGYIWVGVNAGSGLIRFNPSEIDKVAVNRSHEVEYRLYDVSDGLPGDLQWLSRPAAVRAGDGRLWLATGAGASVIDPQQLPRNRRPAPPRIDRVVVDGRASALGRQHRVACRARRRCRWTTAR